MNLFKNTNYKNEINDAINMTTKELEDLIKQEWEVYFPLFSLLASMTNEEMRSLQSMRM